MPLHRDIHWIGRQWAVTGHGMQLIDQKQNGLFDIEAARLWDETLIEGLRTQPWINVADFDKGLDVARKRYRDTPRASQPPEAKIVPAEPATELAPLVAAPPIVPSAPLPEAAAPLEVAKPAESAPQNREAIESTKSVPRKFQMRFLGFAKFIRPWRVRMKK